MKPRFARSAALRCRARRASTLSLFLALFAAGAAHAEGTQEQGSTPDVHRLRSCEIPKVRAITPVLRRQSLSWPAEPCSGSEGEG